MAKQLNVLEEADKLVNGVRDSDYGLPHVNWGNTAKLMTTYLHARGLLPLDMDLDAYDGAMLMVCVKLAREAYKRSRENLVDIAGYAAVAERIRSER